MSEPSGGAPAHAPASSLDELAAQLRRQTVVDDGELLEPKGRRQIERTLQALRVRGLRAFVVLLPRRTTLEPYQALWARVGLREPGDLLLLFSGFGTWWARGWGLDPEVIKADLDHARPALDNYYGSGLIAALERLAHSTGRAGAPRTATTAAQPRHPTAERPATGTPVRPGLLVGGVATMLVVGGVGWLVARRLRRGPQASRSDASD